MNKEASKKMRRVVSTISIVGILSVGGITVTSNFVDFVHKKQETQNEYQEYFQTHAEFEQQRMDYYMQVKEADLSEYDSKFVNLYREGKVSICGKQYPISDLIIEIVEQNGVNQVFLISKNELNKDLLTNQIITSVNYKGAMYFKDSQIMANLYEKYSVTEDNILEISESNLNEVISLLKTFDKSRHTLVPETYYLDNNQDSKVR